MVRIKEASAIGGPRVRLVLTNGQVVERDLTDLLHDAAYQTIREDPAVFRSFRVEAGTLVWPGGIDVCPDMLIWGGPPPADSVAKAS